MNTEGLIIKCITILACVAVLTIGGCRAYSNYQFTKEGYSEQLIPGSQATIWVKNPVK